MLVYVGTDRSLQYTEQFRSRLKYIVGFQYNYVRKI